MAGGRTPRPVRCLDTGETFPSISAAARDLGCDHRALHNALARGIRCGPNRWQYLPAVPARWVRRDWRVYRQGSWWGVERFAHPASAGDRRTVWLVLARPPQRLTFLYGYDAVLFAERRVPVP